MIKCDKEKEFEFFYHIKRFFYMVVEPTPKLIHKMFNLFRSLTVSSNFLNDRVRIRKIQFLGAISSEKEGQPGQGGTTQWKECITYTTST